MYLDFNTIPEFVLFKELTSMDEMFGRVVIDPNYEPRYFKKEERSKVFKEVLDYYRKNNFETLMNEFIEIKTNRTYTLYDNYNNFVFNHPLVVMLYMFIEQGLLTRDLEINKDFKLIELGDEILELTKLKDLKISEGVIFADGKLMKIKSNEAHKIAALWLLLTGRNLSKAIRYTNDCINPEPIFTSMDEYAKLGNDAIVISDQQAIAIYNIYKAKSRSSYDFYSVLANSANLCVTCDGEPNIRYANVRTLERNLGKDIFCAKDILSSLKLQSYLM